MRNTFLILLIGALASSCEKYLDKSPDKKLVVPASIADMQAMVDDASKMNTRQASSGEASADDYYLNYPEWSAITNIGSRNSYIWESELYHNVMPNEWSLTYDVVYVSNSVIQQSEKTDKSPDPAGWDNAVGSAYFFRAYSFWRGLQVWSKAYDATTASSDLGIPLKLIPDFNELSTRASVQAGYDQVISDAMIAVTLLANTPKHTMRPSKAAAYGLLSRTYLSMREYQKAGLYADSSLQLYSSLLNYNDFDVNATYPFPAFNKEVVFNAILPNPPVLSMSRAKIDSNLIASYGINDLRKSLFFRRNTDGTYAFKGSYDGNLTLNTGITVDEMYMTRAECWARQNDRVKALQDLNTLLVTRWKTNQYTPFTANSAAEALELILTERRKELVFRDLRWTDIKRLNKENRNIKIRRVLNGTLYELLPNENRYALPLPGVIVDQTGMPQNPR